MYTIYMYIIYTAKTCIFRPAPRLKDTELTESKSRELYLQCIHIVRTLYHKCRLVHADLSEFNLL